MDNHSWSSKILIICLGHIQHKAPTNSEMDIKRYINESNNQKQPELHDMMLHARGPCQTMRRGKHGAIFFRPIIEVQAGISASIHSDEKKDINAKKGCTLQDRIGRNLSPIGLMVRPSMLRIDRVGRRLRLEQIR